MGYAGGTIGGQLRNRLARLDPGTGMADSFDPNVNSFVYAVAIQPDGKFLAAGDFSGANSIGGPVRVQLLPDAVPLPSKVKFTLSVEDSKVTRLQSRSFFARLSNYTAALQYLAVTPTTVTWTRGGSSPQFSQSAIQRRPFVKYLLQLH